MPVYQNQEIDRSCVYVRGIDFASFGDISTVPTVWYFRLFNFLQRIIAMRFMLSSMLVLTICHSSQSFYNYSFVNKLKSIIL